MKFPKQSHINKSKANQEFSEELARLNLGHKDWEIVAIFYAAVHLLQAYFTSKTPYYPQTHQDRDDRILKDHLLKKIYDDYRELKTLSVSCRYMCWPVNQADVDSAKQSFSAIQQYINSLL